MTKFILDASGLPRCFLFFDPLRFDRQPIAAFPISYDI